MSQISRLHLKLISLDCPSGLVAERAGIKQSRLSEYRHNKRRVPMGHLIALCDVLGCDPEDLVGDVEVDEVAING